MPDGPGYHNRKGHICSKICSLLITLTDEPSKYDELAPKIEYWIEYVLREQFATVDELVEGVSEVAWRGGGSFAIAGRFLKEFHDAPHRSERARSFVAQLCPYVLRLFAIASVEDILISSGYNSNSISSFGGPGFLRGASFVGHLIERGLLAPELVRRHLFKPLINHYTTSQTADVYRANAIYQLFTTAGNTLLQGVVGPEDVQACFGILDFRRDLQIAGFDPAKLQVQYLLR